MPTVTPTVFLSSRFEEFAEHRKELAERLRKARVIPCVVRDLGENYPDERPPIDLCREEAQNADVVILMLGRSYGPCPPGEERSYTHLEYEAATSRNSRAILLPYFFEGSSNVVPEAQISRLKEKVLLRHTVSRFRISDDPVEVATSIVEHVRNRVISVLGISPGQSADSEHGQDENEAEAVEADHLIENEKLLQLAGNDVEQWPDRKLLTAPAFVAASEQKREADRARSLGERRQAIAHLQRALEHRPLDAAALYWCAHLQLLSGRRDEARAAYRMALQAARILERDGDDAAVHRRSLPIAACYLVAARAAGVVEDASAAVELATRAQEIARFYWAAPFEKARQHALAGNARQAMECLADAFYLRPRSLVVARDEIAFHRCHSELSTLRTVLESRTRRDVQTIVDAELKLNAEIAAVAYGISSSAQLLNSAGLVARKIIELDRKRLDDSNLESLLAIARNSFTRQVRALSAVAAQAMELTAKRMEVPARLTAAEHTSKRTRSAIEQQINTLIMEESRARKRKVDQIVEIGCATAIATTVAALLCFLTSNTTTGWVAAVLTTIIVVGTVAAAYEVRNRLAPPKTLAELKKSLANEERRTDTERLAIEAEHHAMGGSLTECVTILLGRVRVLEEVALKKRIYSPTAATHAPKPGELVRLKAGDHAGLAFEDELLPEVLTPSINLTELALGTLRLYRIKHDETRGLVASRRAVYFQ